MSICLFVCLSVSLSGRPSVCLSDLFIRVQSYYPRPIWDGIRMVIGLVFGGYSTILTTACGTVALQVGVALSTSFLAAMRRPSGGGSSMALITSLLSRLCHDCVVSGGGWKEQVQH